MAPSETRPPSGIQQKDKGKKGKKQKKPKDFRSTVLWIYLGASLVSAFYSPIQDADEVFNYWEPTHYLTNGSGAQTWEYSPEYAIRSWSYTGLHAAVIYLGTFIPHITTPIGLFFLLRIVLAFAYSSIQTRFTFSLANSFGLVPALFYTLIMTTCTGMFHASTAYLPSSFSMYGVLLANCAIMKAKPSLSTALSILTIGSLLGWPFTAVLVLPMALDYFIRAVTAGEISTLFKSVFAAAATSGNFLLLQCAVDSAFYRKGACVPWNIVLYNVFGGSDHGPDLFGTESFDFYFRNLFLNFNIWFILALAAAPVLLMRPLFITDIPQTASFKRALTLISPFYLWLAIFSLQPHKEERFMYPIYPFIGMNAALSLYYIFVILNSPALPIISRLSPKFKLVAFSVAVGLIVNVNLLRNLRLHTGYFAPLEIYNPLHEAGVTQPGDIVCIGKEWHRFPSSYFLPTNASVGFVSSSFRGLLPGHFEDNEDNTRSGFFTAAGSIPIGMNNQNLEDPTKYTDLHSCAFLVDSHFPSTNPSEEEPKYIADTKTWEKVACLPYLDAASTGGLDRWIWLPDTISKMIGGKDGGAKWGEYCLLKRRE